MNSVLVDACILIKPSNKLCEYLMKQNAEHLPLRLRSIGLNDKSIIQEKTEQNHNVFITAADELFISSLNSLFKTDETLTHLFSTSDIETFSSKNLTEQYLQIDDLIWLYRHLEKQRQQNGARVYLHELMQGCVICVPENEKIERNPDLEKRCTYLKTQQENRRYKSMTKNVDNVRKRHPEDTIAYQMKQLNRQLVAVFQFVISVLTGFAFGFIGIELMVGTLDFGFKLLIGIMCALIVAVAELYFLAKQLAEL